MYRRPTFNLSSAWLIVVTYFSNFSGLRSPLLQYTLCPASDSRIEQRSASCTSVRPFSRDSQTYISAAAIGGKLTSKSSQFWTDMMDKWQLLILFQSIILIMYEQMSVEERQAFDAVDIPRERAEQDGKYRRTLCWLMHNSVTIQMDAGFADRHGTCPLAVRHAS